MNTLLAALAWIGIGIAIVLFCETIYATYRVLYFKHRKNRNRNPTAEDNERSKL